MRAASAVVGDHMYVCGGHDDFGRPHISVERFDTLSEVWEAQPAMAQGRFNACAAVIRERIHVVGGRVGTGRIRVPSSALTVHGPRCYP